MIPAPALPRRPTIRWEDVYFGRSRFREETGCRAGPAPSILATSDMTRPRLVNPTRPDAGSSTSCSDNP